MNTLIMKKLFLKILFVLFFTSYAKSQIADKFGVNAGLSYSNQLWKYKLFSKTTPNQTYKIGLSSFIFAEKNINKLLGIRTEIGYIQKGFKEKNTPKFPDGNSVKIIRDNLLLHDIALNINFKIAPLHFRFTPYGLLGFRCDYMFSYRNIQIEEVGSGLVIDSYSDITQEFKKLNIGGLIGLGVEFNDVMYLELEYNPSITKSINEQLLDIKDICWEIKMGVNINKLIKN